MYQSHVEIFTQSSALRDTFDYVTSKKDDIKSLFATVNPDEIVFVGCGSSYWLSMSAAKTFHKLTGKRCTAVASGDVLMHPSHYQTEFRNPLFISPSRSGNTSETLAALELLSKTYRSRALSITEYKDSPIEAMSDYTLFLPWANEVSVCQTRSFSSLYLASLLIAAIVSNNDPLLADLHRYVTESGQLIAKYESGLQDLASSFSDWEYAVSLGHGEQFGAACEGAYILVEMAQLPSSYYQTLELRHGPIVLLDKGSLVAFFTSSQSALETQLIQEVQSKGSRVLVISGTDVEMDNVMNLSVGWNATPEVIALFGSYVMQGLAYYKALEKGLDPDRPVDLNPWISI